MASRTELIAPCGLDCGICELYLCRHNEDMKKYLVSMGMPEKALPCDGCRAVEGRCPATPGTCATFTCAEDRGVAHCCDCSDFPCDKLAPAADRAATLPHNLKLCNLCVLLRQGPEALVRKSGAIKKAYFKGKMKIGEGPVLTEE